MKIQKMAITICVCWLVGLCGPIHLYSTTLAQDPSNGVDIQAVFGSLQEGKYLKALSLVERAATENDMKQELATLLAFVGEYERAISTFDPSEPRKDDKNTDLAKQLQATEAISALDAIVEAAKNRQIVILNEAHHVPRHRAFAIQLAIRLRELGFEYFAAEALSPATEELQRRGYPDLHTGFYTSEPIFGDLIRVTLQRGYTPIAYEMTSAPPNSDDWLAQINYREAEQCQNLVEKIFKKNSQAKVFVFVGYSHAVEVPIKHDDGGEQKWMAARLKEATGLDPLTIDQTMHVDYDSNPNSLNPWQEKIAQAGTSEPVVIRSAPGKFFVHGTYAGQVDMQVIHPRTKLVQGRPDWLLSLPQRQAVEIPAEVLKSDKRLLIQAFAESETDNAVPADQILFIPGTTPPVLALREGNYRIVAQTEAGEAVPYGNKAVTKMTAP